MTHPEICFLCVLLRSSSSCSGYFLVAHTDIDIDTDTPEDAIRSKKPVNELLLVAATSSRETKYIYLSLFLSPAECTQLKQRNNEEQTINVQRKSTRRCRRIDCENVNNSAPPAGPERNDLEKYATVS